MTNTVKFFTALGLAGIMSPVIASGITSVPEPSTLSLLGLGGVIAVVIAIRKWRK